MNDNALTAVDMSSLHVDEPMTPIAALSMGKEPLLDCGKGLDRVIFMRRILSVAREYVNDYDLVAAAARAGLPFELVRYYERDPVFITAVKTVQEAMDPQHIVTRSEVLHLLKREAVTAGKARDRIAAIKTLAHVAGFTTGEDGGPKSGSGAPVINISFNGVKTEKPVVELGEEDLRLL